MGPSGGEENKEEQLPYASPAAAPSAGEFNGKCLLQLELRTLAPVVPLPPLFGQLHHLDRIPLPTSVLLSYTPHCPPLDSTSLLSSPFSESTFCRLLLKSALVPLLSSSHPCSNCSHYPHKGSSSSSYILYYEGHSLATKPHPSHNNEHLLKLTRASLPPHYPHHLVSRRSSARQSLLATSLPNANPLRSLAHFQTGVAACLPSKIDSSTRSLRSTPLLLHPLYCPE